VPIPRESSGRRREVEVRPLVGVTALFQYLNVVGLVTGTASTR